MKKTEVIHITLLLFIGINYTVSLICYTVHWNAYSSFTERAHKCNMDEEFCASLYDRRAESWYLRTIPLDRKCYSVAELRNRIDCNMSTINEGCFMDPRYNSYTRSSFLLPVCICKGDYCNTQEKIENIWLEQNIYEFHQPEDCNDKLKKEESVTKSVTSSETTITVDELDVATTTKEMPKLSSETTTDIIAMSTSMEKTKITPDVSEFSNRTTNISSPEAKAAISAYSKNFVNFNQTNSSDSNFTTTRI